MTAPVDVLAVMDRAAGGLYPINFDASLEVIQARAAVAELMDKAATAELNLRNLVNAGQVAPAYLHYADDLQAALARCEGDA